NSTDRLTKPMIKQGGQWQETDWQTALEYVAHGLRNIKHEHGADAIATVATANSTLEELFLSQKIMRGLGTENIDFRLRQSDFSISAEIKPWLGMSINDFGHLKNVFVIGSFLRKDHPLLAARLRQAVKMGAKLSILHATDDDLLIPVANKAILAPSAWLAFLAEVAVAIANKKEIAKPVGFESIQVSSAAEAIAQSLLASGDAAASGVFIGNAAAQYNDAAKIHALAQWIAQNSGAGFGYLTEAANTVGAHLVNAKPVANVGSLFSTPKKAYVLLNTEPEFDIANPHQAKLALNQAEMVIVLSAFKHATDYADVLLPVSPFTETSGTFVNCEGRAQSFHGVVKPLGDTRPAWKVLRVLGNLLGLDGFEFETSEAIRDEVLGKDVKDISAKLNNFSSIAPSLSNTVGGLERVSDVPIYSTDAIVRRSESLQRTTDAKTGNVWLSSVEFAKLGIAAGDFVKLVQGDAVAILPAALDKALPDNVLRLAAGVVATQALGGMFGAISVERAV
ncbi:MAG: molybdopterin-dependent oxidoreductase, partial [Burkholderiales bacterium]|nr:molybdopterin-dependent oxidoreductase [Burkholderiales bacterium]